MAETTPIQPLMTWDEADELAEETLRFVDECVELLRAARLAEDARREADRRFVACLQEVFAEADADSDEMD
jgi:hypothetical protein